MASYCTLSFDQLADLSFDDYAEMVICSILNSKPIFFFYVPQTIVSIPKLTKEYIYIPKVKQN